MAVKTRKPSVKRSAQSLKVVDDLFGGDIELALFYAAWLENDRNATRAYKQLHPGVSDASCRVLGSRVLAKVDKNTVLADYGLDLNRYLTKVDRGLDATKKDSYTGEVVDDQPTQIHYHTKLGDILGISKQESTNITIVNPIYNGISRHDRDPESIPAQEAD